MRTWLLVLVAVGVVPALTGCKPSNDMPGGRLQIFVDWPAPERSLPSYAQSVVIKVIPVCCGDPETKIINRPTDGKIHTDVTFLGLPETLPDDDSAYINQECYILAYSKSDGKGEVVGVLDFFFHFDDGTDYRGYNVTADISATAAELRADLPGPIKVGDTATLHGYAVDSAGWALMLPDGALLWSAENGTELADITPAGKVTAKKAGTFKARLREVDGQVAPLIVQVPIVDAKR